MTASPSENPASAVPRKTVVKLGGLTLTGLPATIFLGAILIGIAALTVRMRPSPGMLLSAALWLAFLIYWSIAARKSAPVASTESAKSRALHQLVLNLSLLLLFIPVPGLINRILPDTARGLAAGLALQVLAFGLAIWARRHLGRNWSAEVTIKRDHQLVRSGPYRFIRHPIYTAMLGMFAGTTLVSGQVHSLIALLLLTGAYWRKIRLEETALRETFGDTYLAYRRKTWALIPGVL
jgi:protein-S-isoprenylcysteine O-methyltransferase Ste14